MNAAAVSFVSDPMASPSCTVCGAVMQLRCRSCGSSPSPSPSESPIPAAYRRLEFYAAFVVGFLLGCVLAIALLFAFPPRRPSGPQNLTVTVQSLAVYAPAGGVFQSRFSSRKAG